MGDDKELSVADMAALGRTIEDHRPKLLAMVRRRIDPSLAVRIDPEEVLSEAFLLACRKWKAFCGQSSLTSYAWLYRIVWTVYWKHGPGRRGGGVIFAAKCPGRSRSSMQLGLKLLATTTSPSKAAARGTAAIGAAGHAAIATARPGYPCDAAFRSAFVLRSGRGVADHGKRRDRPLCPGPAEVQGPVAATDGREQMR